MSDEVKASDQAESTRTKTKVRRPKTKALRPKANASSNR
jgi:hypothetical protein